MTETFEFQAEINQLMSLIINAVYKNNDIFLRELVSNASDAIDKIKYLGYTDSEQLKTGDNFCIKIIPDKETKTLSIIDTGIGMTKEDLKNNLGTIAKSGTKDFLKTIQDQLKDQKDLNMIGKFGVGFYSAYLVANVVEVYSKNNNDSAYRWSSEAGSTFTIDPVETMPYNLERGTFIILHMKDNCLEYLEEQKLKDVIKTHSQFVSYDILLGTMRTKSKSDTTNDKSKESESDSDDEVEDVDIETTTQNNTSDTQEESKDETQEESKDDTCDETCDETQEETKDETCDETKEEKKVLEFDKLNEVPIWSKSHTDVTEDEYKQFYKVLSGESWATYATYNHFHIEGSNDFKAILFVPERAPYDMFNKGSKKNNIKLYVRKVFITDDCEELCPEWMTFVKGVVDSADLPLTVSRENFQQVKTLKQISKSLVKKCIEMLSNLSEDTEKYNAFYKQFSKNLKLGVHEDQTNKQKLLGLLRYKSSFGENQSFSDYCSRTKDNTNIYYLSGEESTVYNSPFAERCLKKGHEVVYMTDPLDEYIMQQITEFEHDGKKFTFVSLTKEGFKLDDNETESENVNMENLCKQMKNILGDKVEKVVKSTRLENTPCVIVTGQYGYTARMEQIINAQAMRSDDMYGGFMKSRKTLEINPNNKIIRDLNKKLSNVNENNTPDKTCVDLVTLLYQSAMLLSGFSLEKPSEFVDKINRIIEVGLNLDDDDTDDNINATDSTNNTNQETKLEESNDMPELENVTNLMECVD